MGEEERKIAREISTIFPKMIWFYVNSNITSKTKIFYSGISILTRFHKKLCVEIFLWCKIYSTYT